MASLNLGSDLAKVMFMPETNALLNPPLPQSYYYGNSSNLAARRRCIRDAQRAARNPDASPAERHLHRIVASAGLECLHHITNRRHEPAQRAERLASDAIRQLETLRLEAAL